MREHEVDMSTYSPLSERDRLPTMAELGGYPEADKPAGRTLLDDAQAKVSIENGEIVIDVREQASADDIELPDFDTIYNAKREIASFSIQQTDGEAKRRLREIGGNEGLV